MERYGAVAILVAVALAGLCAAGTLKAAAGSTPEGPCPGESLCEVQAFSGGTAPRPSLSTVVLPHIAEVPPPAVVWLDRIALGRVSRPDGRLIPLVPRSPPTV